MQASPDRRGRNRRRRPQQGYVLHSYESNGPDIKIRGTPQTIADKYTQLARDSLGSGDLVLAENYFQHAEHYVRLLLTDEAVAPSRSSSSGVSDESLPSSGDESDSNVTPLEYPQGESQENAPLQEGRSYGRPPRNREQGNGDGYHNHRDRMRSSPQRYRSSGGANVSRDDSRGDHHKRLDRGSGRDSRRDHEGHNTGHHNRRSWTQTPGRESEGAHVEREHSSSSTFNQGGLPAFLATPVASRPPGSPQARGDSFPEVAPSSGFEKKNLEVSAKVGDSESLPLSTMEASES